MALVGAEREPLDSTGHVYVKLFFPPQHSKYLWLAAGRGKHQLRLFRGRTTSRAGCRWGRTWTLEGDQLTLKVPDLKTNNTFTLTIDGDDLLLDGDRYRRYAP
jgi:hypothetical protein